MRRVNPRAAEGQQRQALKDRIGGGVEKKQSRRSTQAVPFWAWMTIVAVGLVLMIALPLMGR
ncbi:hypothetical protein PQI23_08280 [Leucobacter sp. USCH14]|uniref:hypothetical protein n=1 Tax=Leucobacter sp. USCH14 TaxID=3024838 RepID=UPI0030B5A2CA